MVSWFYGPNGEEGIFDACPDGWHDHPCKCVKPKGGDLSAAIEVFEDAAAQIAAFDGDGDGRIGGSLPKAKRKPKKVTRDDPRL